MRAGSCALCGAVAEGVDLVEQRLDGLEASGSMAAVSMQAL
jgi:hypothetical protein